MSVVAIVIVVLLAVLVLMAIGGAIARRRQLEATEGTFRAHLSAINEELALARAQDRGWERELVEAAAVAAYAEQGLPDADAASLTLVQVVDRPGTDDDKAVFADATGRRLTLGRLDGAWVFEKLDR